MTTPVKAAEPTFLCPGTLAEALQARAEQPAATPIAGGTDVMVELNFGRHAPGPLLDLTRVPELATWDVEGDLVRLGATVSYGTVVDELRTLLPALAVAARTVGSPQIRNRGTVGGNLGAASPAGDSHPPLLATGAEVEVASVRGTRRIPVDEFYLGVNQTALVSDELITAVLIPRAAGPQQFAKIGPRNAMVIAVCSCAVALDSTRREVGVGIGSVGPTPLRAIAAQRFASIELPWQQRGRLDDDLVDRFGALVADAATPIDDVRSTAGYRKHALAVLARRSLCWAWEEYRCG